MFDDAPHVVGRKANCIAETYFLLFMSLTSVIAIIKIIKKRGEVTYRNNED